MYGLSMIKPVSEYHEKDSDQGIERIYLYYKLNTLETSKQTVDILETVKNGKMLFLDGTLQSTSQDEVIYHNALVHPLLDTILNKDDILILGGGEGATAREVLRWTSVKNVTMVDYDKELVEYMKHNGAEWSRGAFYNKRLKVIYDDAWKFMKENHDYDGVIIDLTDPDLNNELWLTLLKGVMESIKEKNGGFVMNAGLYLPWNTKKLNEIVEIIKELCVLYSNYKYYIYTKYIPSFNGEWTFIVVSHKQKFMTEPEYSQIIPEWIRRGIKMLPDSLLKSVSAYPNIDRIV
jgi:spermidine synthase